MEDLFKEEETLNASQAELADTEEAEAAEAVKNQDAYDTRAKRILIADLPSGDKPLKQVKMKPYTSIIVCVLLAVFLIGVNFIPWAGWIILAIAVLELVLIPDYKILDAYQDYFVVYTRKDNVYCQMVRWDEIERWALKSGKSATDAVVVQIGEDGLEEYVFVPSFNSMKLIRVFNKFAGSKEANKQQLAKMKNSAFHVFPKRDKKG